MKILDIGVDLDGVVYDFVGALRTWIHASTNKPLAEMPPARTWQFYHDWGFTTEEFLFHYAAGVNAGRIMRYGTPFPGSAEYMRRLARDGHRLHIITARAVRGAEKKAAINTAHWLRDYDIPHATLTITADKHVSATDIFIEDSAANYDSLEAAGRHPWLIDQPYNSHHSGRRVHSWREFYTVATALAHAS
jgi:uncharacterized HAD superfamily protein